MGVYPIGIVGESFENDDGSSRQAEIGRCNVGEAVRLERDPDNPYDSNCVKVISARDVQIGNISRNDGWICERLDRDGFVEARILSITKARAGKFGVVLCVRTNADEEWLDDFDLDTNSSGGRAEPAGTGCAVLFLALAPLVGVNIVH